MGSRRLIDSHAHLSDLEDKEGVISRAKEAGVDAVVAVGANLSTCESTLRWAAAYPGIVFPALGIHPTEWEGDDVPVTLHFIDERLDDCVAVGEIGLDYWSKSARKDGKIRERQREIYIAQLEMAAEHSKPVSVHGRGSWRDALDLARQHGPEGIVFHWYSGPLEILGEVLDSGYLISATPACEFSKHHRAALEATPLKSILMETDSPVSYHGKQGEPADLVLTLKHLSEIKGASEKDVARTTSRNAVRFFGL